MVSAYAGGGKTSVLAEYARRRPNERFLYLAFNKAIKLEAERRFPSNVKCMTTHGIAYAGFGRDYSHKLGNPRPYHLTKALGLDLVSAGVVLDVVAAYLSSTDDNFNEGHTSRARVDQKSIGHALDLARRTWAMMRDPANTEVPMPHDGYLKLFQLSRPVIRKGCILLDEAQDSNPLIYDIVKQQHCRKILVGDEYQGIYAFRGALNAMHDFRKIADEELFLTASFRFGAGIASLATALLADWRGETRPLRGLGPTPTRWGVDQNAPHTVISRSNGALFAEAVGHVLAGHPFGYLGGVEAYRMSSILDVYHLHAGSFELIQDRFFRAFDGWDQFREYAETLDDRESLSLIKIIDTYGNATPGLVERIRKEAVDELTGNEIILTTAHKAKGLEWDNVRLLDDFVELVIDVDKETGKPKYPDKEEINLHYVAITRALKRLEVGDKIVDWLDKANHHHLLFPILGGFKRDTHEPALALPAAGSLCRTPAALSQLVKRLRSGEQLSQADANNAASIIEAWCAREAQNR